MVRFTFSPFKFKYSQRPWDREINFYIVFIVSFATIFWAKKAEREVETITT
jgi:hypothetical protein